MKCTCTHKQRRCLCLDEPESYNTCLSSKSNLTKDLFAEIDFILTSVPLALD